jgi:hypothetical protein
MNSKHFWASGKHRAKFDEEFCAHSVQVASVEGTWTLFFPSIAGAYIEYSLHRVRDGCDGGWIRRWLFVTTQ